MQTRYRLPLFYTACIFFWMSQYIYIPYVAAYAEFLEADLRLIGLIAGAYGLVQMVLRFPLGIYSDKIQKRKIFIVAGMGFAALSGLVAFFFPYPIAFLVSRGFAGVAASVWVIFAVLGPSYYKPEDTVKSIGILNTFYAFGRMVAFVPAGFIAQWLGMPYAFLLGGIVSLIGFSLTLGLVEKKPETAKEPPSLASLLVVAKNKQLLCASFLGVINLYMLFSTVFGFTPIVAAHMDASYYQLALLGLLSTLPAVIVAPLMGRISDKIGVASTLVLFLALGVVGTVSIVFCTQLWQVFFMQIVSGAGLFGLMALLMGLAIRDISVERRATAMGFFQAVYGMGMFLGPFVTGWISHGFGLMVAFAVTGAIGVVGMVASIIFARKGYIRGN